MATKTMKYGTALRSAGAAGVSPDITKEIPNGDHYLHRLLQEVISLRALAQLPLAKKDTRFEEHQWSSLTATEEQSIPQVIAELVQFVRNKCEVIKESSYRVHLGCYTRMAGMKVSPPPVTTGNRIMLNFGNEEVFHLSPFVEQPKEKDETEGTQNKSSSLNLIQEVIENKTKVRIDTGLPERQVYLAPNRMMELGTITSSNYAIYVKKQDSTFTRPAVYEGGGRVTPARTTLRPAKYFRVMIIIDFLTEQETIDEIANKARAVADTIDVKKIDEMLKQQKIDIKKEKNEKRLPRKDEDEVDAALEAMREKSVENNSNQS